MIFIHGNCVSIYLHFLCKYYDMKKLIPLLALLIISIPLAIADEDEYEDEYEDEEDRMGFGIMEREREREHQDDEEIAIGSDTGNMILYGTIAAIIASVAYTGFKLYKAKSTISKT